MGEGLPDGPADETDAAPRMSWVLRGPDCGPAGQRLALSSKQRYHGRQAAVEVARRRLSELGRGPLPESGLPEGYEVAHMPASTVPGRAERMSWVLRGPDCGPAGQRLTLTFNQHKSDCKAAVEAARQLLSELGRDPLPESGLPEGYEVARVPTTTTTGSREQTSWTLSGPALGDEPVLLVLRNYYRHLKDAVAEARRVLGELHGVALPEEPGLLPEGYEVAQEPAKTAMKRDAYNAAWVVKGPAFGRKGLVLELPAGARCRVVAVSQARRALSESGVEPPQHGGLPEGYTLEPGAYFKWRALEQRYAAWLLSGPACGPEGLLLKLPAGQRNEEGAVAEARRALAEIGEELPLEEGRLPEGYNLTPNAYARKRGEALLVAAWLLSGPTCGPKGLVLELPRGQRNEEGAVAEARRVLAEMGEELPAEEGRLPEGYSLQSGAYQNRARQQIAVSAWTLSGPACGPEGLLLKLPREQRNEAGAVAEARRALAEMGEELPPEEGRLPEGYGVARSGYQRRSALQNVGKHQRRGGTSSSFANVSWAAKTRKWCAHVHIRVEGYPKGRKIHLGSFDNEMEAARAHDVAKVANHNAGLTFARVDKLNFPAEWREVDDEDGGSRKVIVPR